NRDMARPTAASTWATQHPVSRTRREAIEAVSSSQPPARPRADSASSYPWRSMLLLPHLRTTEDACHPPKRVITALENRGARRRASRAFCAPFSPFDERARTQTGPTGVPHQGGHCVPRRGPPPRFATSNPPPAPPAPTDRRCAPNDAQN